MNWITVAAVASIAAWFEYSYRRSRRKKAAPTDAAAVPSGSSVAQTARVAQPGNTPSIVPGDENDKQMNAAV